MGPTVGVRYHTIVRNRDVELAKLMWSVSVQPNFTDSKRRVLQLPAAMRPASPYVDAPPCEALSGTSMVHRVFDNDFGFTPTKLRLELLPHATPIYAQVMAKMCRTDAGCMHNERRFYDSGERIGGFVPR